MDKLKVFTAFSGYDSQCMALDRLGIDYELVGWSEIDKYAIIAHDAVYPQWKDGNFGDICKIDWNYVHNFDLFTYSFPCTDISSAGLQKGLEEGSGTRSSLLWECKKAIDTKKPKYLLMENVKALTSHKFLPYLHKWMSYLDSLGYSSYAKVINAKDYGVPQNRERLFVVSILEEGCYEFPAPFELKLKLKDILESNVDESYYISDKTVNRMIRNNRTDDFCVDTNGVAKTICSSCYKMTTFDNYIINPYIKQYPRGFNDGFEYKDGICPTITTSSWQHNNFAITGKSIRMLTTIECFRLMGVSEEDIDKIQSAGISKTQQYKMAGNSIVVDVLYHIFRKLFIDKKQETSQLTLF